MALLAVLYAVVVIAVARWRGFRALLGLVGAYFVLVRFILPGLVEGKPPLLLALVGSTVIMIGVLYFAHGFSARTSTALLGTIFGLGITALLGRLGYRRRQPRRSRKPRRRHARQHVGQDLAFPASCSAA